MKLHLLGIGLALLLTQNSAFAVKNESTEVVSNRMKNKLGFFVGLNEPSPTLLGVGASYHIADYLKTYVGYGYLKTTTSITFTEAGFESTEASIHTIGTGLQGMVPGWNLTPTAGVHVAYVGYSGKGLRVGGFEESGAHLYASLGVDYQSEGGFNVNAGYHMSFKSGVDSGIYLGLGYFFDWLA